MHNLAVNFGKMLNIVNILVKNLPTTKEIFLAVELYLSFQTWK